MKIVMATLAASALAISGCQADNSTKQGTYEGVPTPTSNDDGTISPTGMATNVDTGTSAGEESTTGTANP